MIGEAVSLGNSPDANYPSGLDSARSDPLRGASPSRYASERSDALRGPSPSRSDVLAVSVNYFEP